jgi:MFS transporter, DHA2 family, multidrug resistance protein
MTEPSGSDPRSNKWLVAVTVMVPTAMEILDTSVANVSLSHIQGSLSAGLDEVTWVLTSYLVANAVVLPLTGWLAATFGRKRLLVICVAGFTLFSFLCGAAPSLGTLVAFRVAQGLFGGALQPMSQAILLETFPREQHGTAMAFYTMGIVAAPIFGPILGGYITDHLSWRWIFYINVPIGTASVIAILAVLHDPAYLKSLRSRADPFGIGLLAVSIGALQIMLDKGNQEDWFGSTFIIGCALLAFCSFVLLVWWELYGTATPVVNLRVLRIRSFATGIVLMFVTYFSFFASIVLLPLYLQQLMGYTAFDAGLVLGPGGIATVLLLPLVGRLVQRGRAREILLVGLVVTAWSISLMSKFSLLADFGSVIEPRIIQGLGIACFFVPLTTLTMSGIPQAQIGQVTGLYSLLRNLGGAIGVSFGSTLLAQRSQFHLFRIAERLDFGNPEARAALASLGRFLRQRGVPQPLAAQGADDVVYGEALRQALMLAFNDCFHTLFLFVLLAVPLVFFFTRPREGGGH